MEDLRFKGGDSYPYLDKFEGYLNKLSVEVSVPVDEIKYIVDDFFLRLKRWITDPRMPTIKINNFGTFRPCPGQISRSLKRSVKCYRLGSTPPERLRALIRDIWPIRKRLQKEKNGEITWREWRNKVMKQED